MIRIFTVFLIFLACSEMEIYKRWKDKSEKYPVSVLREIGDSLNSPKFRRRIARTPFGPKILDLALNISKNLNYANLPLDSLVKCAYGMKGVVMFIYDFGLFDERWSESLFAYKNILSHALKKLYKVQDLDSLEKITYALQPPIMAGIYKKEYLSLIELYRSKSIARGEVRWGMSEEDVIKAWGEPDSVDTVYSVSNASFGKIMHWIKEGKGVLILDGRVEDIFEE